MTKVLPGMRSLHRLQERKHFMQKHHQESEPAQQPSLFSSVPSFQDNMPSAAEKRPEETIRPNEYYLALDRLLEAMEDLLSSNYPVNDELRRRLSNPGLEALIFEEMNKVLKKAQE
jgi:hypothetical protein